ncbi:nucleotidyltransferase domain-containing protein [Phosphitispora fastidiosa]|uniref:nucleotidyltransferase domain-containing protein n=1 Tax=Phosphitispora fastidiosa TaxID=2837202 RepID=UPI001E3E52F9|nr:nucleotidyltransferase domain-containing protein [Phosphitispora fastidiosa]MBU7007082.1 putative nucleotidyltransferase [Phosphitispora fastidiosa]
MPIYDETIQNVKRQIVNKFHPVDVILFGSHAKGLVRKSSDIDICVIKDTQNKRELIQDILLEIDSDIDLDVIVYTPAQWEKYKDDKTMFAHVINKTGVSIVG